MNPEIYDGMNQINGELNSLTQAINTNIKRRLSVVDNQIGDIEIACRVPPCDINPPPPDGIIISAHCDDATRINIGNMSFAPDCKIKICAMVSKPPPTNPGAPWSSCEPTLGMAGSQQNWKCCTGDFLASDYDIVVSNLLNTYGADKPTTFNVSVVEFDPNCPPISCDSGGTGGPEIPPDKPKPTEGCCPVTVNTQCPPPIIKVENTIENKCPDVIIKEVKQTETIIQKIECKPPPITNIINIQIPEAEGSKDPCAKKCEDMPEGKEKDKCFKELCDKPKNWLQYAISKDGIKELSTYAEQEGFPLQMFGATDIWSAFENWSKIMHDATFGRTSPYDLF